MSKLLFLDIETTGTDPKKHQILQIAAKELDSEEIFNKYVGSGGDGVVDLGALKYNKINIISSGGVMDDNEYNVLTDFCDYLLKLKPKKPMIICGQNVHFDFYFIKERLSKYEIEGLEDLISYKMIDLNTLSTVLVNLGTIETKNNSTCMAQVAKTLGIRVHDEKLHAANYDVKLSEKLYKKLLILLGDNNVDKNSER